MGWKGADKPRRKDNFKPNSKARSGQPAFPPGTRRAQGSKLFQPTGLRG